MVYRVNVSISPVDLTDLYVINNDVSEDYPFRIFNKSEFTIETSEDYLLGRVIGAAITDRITFLSSGYEPITKTISELDEEPTITLTQATEFKNVSNGVDNYPVKDEMARNVLNNLKDVAFSANYEDLTGTPTVDQTYSGTSTNAQSGKAVSSAILTKANTGLSNLTSGGKNIGTWSTNLTNCITEIPQDINLTLSSGTLTLKAGSKAYMPNGSGVFDIITNSNDLTYTLNANGEHLICVAYNAGGITSRPISSCTSGAGATAVSGFAYNTTTNKINNYSASGTIGGQYTFPIAVITVSDGAISRIDQVFNGFGYIGSSVFALPGIKGLRPDGRNSDGTLKNVYWTCNSVVVRTFPVNENFPGASLLFNGSAFFRLSRGAYSYNQKENYNYNVNDRYNVTIIGSLDETAGVVSNFNTNPAFHAVDYSEFKQTDDENVKITGNQSYSGIKTSTTANGIQATVSGSNNIIQKNTAIDITDSSRATAYANGFSIQDKNEYMAGVFGTTFGTTGSVQSFVQARNRATGSQVQGQISITVNNAGNITTSAPTPSDTTSTSSTQIATTGWVNTAGNNVVHRSSDETIGGTKTFSSNIYMETSGTSGRFYSKNTSLDLTNTSRTNDIGIGFRSVDKNDNIAGEFVNAFTTAGTAYAVMQVRNRASGSQVTSQIRIAIDKNGNISTECPTPSSATDNSTKIATTAWVWNFLKGISGYSASKTQTLKNVNGTFKWIDG